MIVALAEELLASVWLVVIWLSAMLLFVGGAQALDITNMGKPASIATTAIKEIGLFLRIVRPKQRRLPVR